MRGGLADFGRLIVLILFLPLILIGLGPLLILAVLRGKQRFGPITLNAARYDTVGKAGIFLLGAATWILVWGGLGWLALAAITPIRPAAVELTQAEQVDSTVAEASPTPSATASPAGATTETLTVTETAGADSTATSTLTSTPLPTPTATATASPTATPTPTVPTSTPTQTASPTATETNTPIATATATPTFTFTPSPSPTNTPTATATDTATATATNTATPTFTFTPLPTPTNSPTNTPTPTPTATNTGTPTVSPASAAGLTSTPVPTLAASERQAVLAALRGGNEALRRTIEAATDENLAALETFWGGRALQEVSTLAVDARERYGRLFTADLEYVRQPAIGNPISARHIFVTSRERWSYRGSTTAREELFEFLYTVSRRGDGWIITNFSFRQLTTPTPTLFPPKRPAFTATPQPTTDAG